MSRCSSSTEPLDQLAMAFFVVRPVREDDVAVAIERDAIVRSGRSSEVSQKSSEWRAIASSVIPGTNGGAPADSATASSLPTNEMCPMG